MRAFLRAGTGLASLVGATTRRPGSCDQWDRYGGNLWRSRGIGVTVVRPIGGQPPARQFSLPDMVFCGLAGCSHGGACWVGAFLVIEAQMARISRWFRLSHGKPVALHGVEGYGSVVTVSISCQSAGTGETGGFDRSLTLAAPVEPCGRAQTRKILMGKTALFARRVGPG